MADQFSLRTHLNGTHTLVDEENGQAMHSRVGPETEARLVYADAAQIERRLNDPSDTVVLYDVGLGTGANVLSCLERLYQFPEAHGTLQIFSFETKLKGLESALRCVHEDPRIFPFLAKWENIVRPLLARAPGDLGRSSFTVGSVAVEWTVLVGDFYTRLTEVPPADVIFFDLYSPKIVPELWSAECFLRLHSHLDPHDCVLYTYSASTPVRLHFLAAGFFVGRGMSTGVKNETTAVATRLDRLAKPLGRDWLLKLNTSASIAGPEFDGLKSQVLRHPQWNASSAEVKRRKPLLRPFR